MISKKERERKRMINWQQRSTQQMNNIVVNVKFSGVIVAQLKVTVSPVVNTRMLYDFTLTHIQRLMHIHANKQEKKYARQA